MESLVERKKRVCRWPSDGRHDGVDKGMSESKRKEASETHHAISLSEALDPLECAHVRVVCWS